MQIVLIRKKEILKTVLPAKISGQHQIFYAENGEFKPLCAVSADNGEWVIKENKKTELIQNFVTDESGNREIKLKENEFYILRCRANDEQMIILAEPIGTGRSNFSFYNVPADGIINVGYEKENHICYHGGSLSRTVGTHIEYKPNGKILVSDADSINGIYLNGKRVTVTTEARYGDEIYLAGLRIILGNGFVAANNPDGCVASSLVKRNQESFVLRDKDDDSDESVYETFSSAPRQKNGIKQEKISVESPPQPSEEQKTPWLLVMGPSITMAFGSVFSSVFTIQNIMNSNGDISSAIPTLVMAVCMVLGTIIWPLFSKRFEKRNRIAKDNKKKRRYAEHLEKVKGIIGKVIENQTELLKKNNPSIEECISRINAREMTLWERSPVHDDFLDVMIGTGDIPAKIELEYSKRRDTEELGESAKAMDELVNAGRILKNVPVTIPFAKTKIVGMTGERYEVISIVKALIIELTALHNYEDLKIMFIYNEKENHLWKFAKWIPHVWNNEKTVRFIANDIDEAKELSNIISNINAVSENERDETIATRYLIIAADRILAEKIQALKDFVKEPSKYKNISLLALYDERKYLPKSCSVVCSAEQSSLVVADYNNIAEKPQKIDVPVRYEGDPESIFVNMANIRLDSRSGETILPTELTYLEMFEAGKPEHLDVLSHWEENDPVKSLAAPIGVDADGYTIKLDIHEKAHGPHGLIAGMTGSGKSEFIISYIASMAVNYSPEEVAFVLIDFKGGGMADVFKKLPHLAGSITNLDGNELQRSFIAIESELEKRQTLFKEISEKKKISNIDIYKYQKLRREDKSLKALPHLIIISDEFAELRDQHNDFMDQLIRIARIGRSLGVHLILATQKPDGVVNEQIKSNIKFKVCLKVQDKADSQSVIGRPDATMITNAGRFYLQVGYNEIFEYGQSPWSGAPYFPADQYKKTSDNFVDILNEQGRTLYRVKPKAQPRPANVPEKQIDALIDYLSELAKTRNCCADKLWLEPLQGPKEKLKKTNRNSGEEAFVLNPVVGMYDDLKNQKHCVMRVPFTEGGNTVIYGSSGSGKLSFLNSLLVSIIEKHSCEEVSIYALDFDSGSLSAFENAPQVKMIALSEELSLVDKTFEEIEKELDFRKNEFRRFGGDYQNYVRTSGKTLPNIVLVISNFLAFSETAGSAEDKLSRIAREGKKYGIFVVITAMDSRSVRQFVPLFSNVYVLQLNNIEQYGDILNKTGGLIPGGFKGRGIFRQDDSVYEFQTKMVFEDMENTYDAIASFCTSVSEKSCVKKPEVKQVPEVVTKKYFEELGLEFRANNLPVAVDKETIEPICMDFSAAVASAIVYEKRALPSVRTICEELVAAEDDIIVIDPYKTLGISDSKVLSDASKIEEFINDLESLVYNRAAEAISEKSAGNPTPDFKHIYIVVNGFYALKNLIPENMLIKFSGMIFSINDPYHINFIIVSDVETYDKEISYISGMSPFAQGITFSDSSVNYSFFEKKFSKICEKGYAHFVVDNVRRTGKALTKQEEGE